MTRADEIERRQVPSRRDRKKAATRSSISAAALALFLENGFDAVTIREVAVRADVAVATVFAHFVSKEALVFDEQSVHERSLLRAVSDRPAGTSALAAMQQWFLTTRAAENARTADPEFLAFRQLIHQTPALLEHWRAQWRLAAAPLADVLVSTTGAEACTATLTARLAIEGYLTAAEHDQPDRTIKLLFEMLDAGIAAVGAPLGTAGEPRRPGSPEPR